MTQAKEQGQGFQGFTRDQVAVQTKFTPQDVDAIATHLGFKKATYLEAEVKRINEFKAWMQQNQFTSVSKAIEARSAGKAGNAKAGNVPPSGQADTQAGRTVSAAVQNLAQTAAQNLDLEAKELRVASEIHLVNRYRDWMTVPAEQLDDPRLTQCYQQLQAETSTVVTVSAEEVGGSSPLEMLAGIQLPALPARQVHYLSSTTNQRSLPQAALPAAT